MNLVINFNDWRISTSAHDLHEAENLSKRVDVVGEMPAEYPTYMLHVRVRGYEFDPILLTATERGVGAILTSNMLAYGGEKYEFQVWGINGEKTRATNLISILLPESITGDEEWAEIPSAFTQIENRIADMNAHPPIPDADTKKWMLWDPEAQEYQLSDLDVPEAADGRGIDHTEINSDGYLIIYYTDGTSHNAGKVGEGGDYLPLSGGVITGDLGVVGELSLGSTVSITETNVSLLQLTGDNGEQVIIRNVDTPIEDNDAVNKKYVDDNYALKNDLGELSDLDTTDKSSIVAAINEVAASGGTGWTSAQIDLLDALFDHIEYIDAQGGAIADQLIESLRGSTPPEESIIITFDGATAVISGLASTNINYSGTTAEIGG